MRGERGEQPWVAGPTFPAAEAPVTQHGSTSRGVQEHVPESLAKAAIGRAQTTNLQFWKPSQLSLTGESSSIKFSVEPQFFDLGLTPYDRPVERDLHIANSGVKSFID